MGPDNPTDNMRILISSQWSLKKGRHSRKSFEQAMFLELPSMIERLHLLSRLTAVLAQERGSGRGDLLFGVALANRERPAWVI